MNYYVSCVDKFGAPVSAASLTSAVIYKQSDDSVLSAVYTVAGKNIIVFDLADTINDNYYIKINAVKVLDNICIKGKSSVSGMYLELAGGTMTGGIVLGGTAANIATGSNYVSNGGTDAGLSFDASNNATLSAAVNILGVCAADTFRLASGKYIGYSAAAGTPPAGGLSFSTTNNATFTGTVSCNNTSTIARSNATPTFLFYRLNGSSAVSSGNAIGQITCNGYDGSAFKQSVYLQGVATENFTGSVNGGKLEFYTTAIGATTPALRLTISEAGITSASDVNMPSTGYCYIGASGTDGSWRIGLDSGNLVIEKRVSAAWVTKQTII